MFGPARTNASGIRPSIIKCPKIGDPQILHSADLGRRPAPRDVPQQTHDLLCETDVQTLAESVPIDIIGSASPQFILAGIPPNKLLCTPCWSNLLYTHFRCRHTSNSLFRVEEHFQNDCRTLPQKLFCLISCLRKTCPIEFLAQILSPPIEFLPSIKLP